MEVGLSADWSGWLNILIFLDYVVVALWIEWTINEREGRFLMPIIPNELE